MSARGRPAAGLYLRALDGEAVAACVDGIWSGDPDLVHRLAVAEWLHGAEGLLASPAGPVVVPGDPGWPLAVAIRVTGGRCAVGGRVPPPPAPVGPGEVT